MEAAACHVSPYSGSWYPGDAAQLRDLLARLFAESERRTGGFSATRAAGFVVPHAGLKYSGTVAAAAYRQIRAMHPERIVLLGFSHSGAARGIWIPETDAFRTPLGDLPVDRELRAELLAGGAFGSLDERTLCDHSVEIQLPLLQAAAPEARIVPVYVNRPDAEQRRAAAQALASAADAGTVLVASSDLTHYGRSFSFLPFPADDQAAERLRELDESVIDAAGTLDSEELHRVLAKTRATVCGHDPIRLLLEALRCLGTREEIFQDTLDYQTSGEITGDFEQSVSYAALGYFPYRAFELDPEDQRALIESARRALAHYRATGERKPIPADPARSALTRRGAAFVTLHSAGELRGCVGRRASDDSLAGIVPSLALAAALDDVRFAALRRDEPPLDVEISVLTPVKRILSLGQFRVNEHGAMLESGYLHGLLLPQVATERNWNATQFFEALARKAGADRGAYSNPDARVYVFRAQIFR
jgi:MEMO1 family protein